MLLLLLLPPLLTRPGRTFTYSSPAASPAAVVAHCGRRTFSMPAYYAVAASPRPRLSARARRRVWTRQQRRRRHCCAAAAAARHGGERAVRLVDRAAAATAAAAGRVHIPDRGGRPLFRLSIRTQGHRVRAALVSHRSTL